MRPLRLKIMLAVFAVGTLIAGFVGLGKSLKYPFPKRLTYAQILQEKPQHGWYTITGGYFDLANAVLPPTSDSSDYLVPLRGSGETPAAPIHVLVLVDREMSRQIDAYNNSINKPTTVWAMSHQLQLGAPPKTLTIAANVSGMVNETIGSDSELAGKIPEEARAGDDLLTIDKDAHPNAFLALGEIFVGLGLCVFALRAFGIEFDFEAAWQSRGARKSQQAPDLLHYAERGGPGPYGQPVYPPQAPPQYTHPSQSDPPHYPPAYPPPNLSEQPSVDQVPPSPAESRQDKEAAEIARLRESKPFEPFG